MKININNVKKFASLGLVLVSATTLVGCKADLRDIINYKESRGALIQETKKPIKNFELEEESFVEEETKMIVPETMPLEIKIENGDSNITTPIVEETKKPELTLETKKSLLESFDENPIVSDDLNSEIMNYYNEHMDEINDVLNEEHRDIHIKYGSLIYQRLVNAGIPKETILGELANVILEQQLPRCCSEEEWLANYGNIVSVLGEYESMYEAYFCLSYLVHDELCELTHDHNEFGAITCDNLKEGFQKKYNYNKKDV